MDTLGHGAAVIATDAIAIVAALLVLPRSTAVAHVMMRLMMQA